MKIVTMKEFIATYLETQEGTETGLFEILEATQKRFIDVTHFVIYRCADLSSSKMGNRVIMPVGPNNTFKSPDTLPPIWSPTGLPSSNSTPEMIVALD